MGVKVLRVRFRRFTVCPMRIALLAVALAACGSDAPTPEEITGVYSVTWNGSGPGAPTVIDAVSIVPEMDQSGAMVGYAALFTQNGAFSFTTGGDIDGDCLVMSRAAGATHITTLCSVDDGLDGTYQADTSMPVHMLQLRNRVDLPPE